MTQKRFDVVYEEDDEYKNIMYWEVKDKKYGATTSNELKICHLLNNLNDENEQLKNHIKTLQNNTKRLENQNIETYNLIKEAYKNERTALGRSVLKQLIDGVIK